VSKRKKDAIWLGVLCIACGLVIWHTVCWYSTEFHLKMFQWLPTGRGYLTVLYNLGLMLVLGVLLGFIMIKITNLIGYKVRKAEHVDDTKGQN
jgi:hypothetical protein